MRRYLPAIALGRLVRRLVLFVRGSGGSAFPGLVVNRVAPGFLKATLASLSDRLVVVSGSNGKSTTTKMLVEILRAHSLDVFTNPSTANIAQGLTSSFLDAVGRDGRIECDVAVLELDEAYGAKLADAFTARVATFTNVQIDQVARFPDPAGVRDLLARIASRAREAVVVNDDDELLRELARSVETPVYGYRVSGAVRAAHPDGFGYARMSVDPEPRVDDVVVAENSEAKAVLALDGGDHAVSLPSRGVHFALDAAAAVQTARRVLGDGFAIATALSALAELPPVFARGENAVVRGQNIEFILVKNPASFQLNVDALNPGRPLMVAFDDDVHDPSFFWSCRAASLGEVAVVSGSRASELALQLAYEEVEVGRIEPDLVSGFTALLDLEGRDGKTVIFSAAAMRRLRSHLASRTTGGAA